MQRQQRIDAHNPEMTTTTKQRVHLEFKELHDKSGEIDTSTMHPAQSKSPQGSKESIFRSKMKLKCREIYGKISISMLRAGFSMTLSIR